MTIRPAAGKLQVGDVERDQLGAAEGTGKAEQQQRAISEPDARAGHFVQHALQVVDQRGCFAGLGGAEWCGGCRHGCGVTSEEVVGEGRSAALWACEMTTRRRAMVAAFALRSAMSARYAATVSSSAGARRQRVPRRSGENLASRRRRL